MKAKGSVLAGVVLMVALLAGCRAKTTPGGRNVSPPPPPPRPTASAYPLGEGQTLGEPIIHANMAVYPVRSSVQAEVADYLTLDEALQKGLIEVTEKDQAEVNEVYVTNLADLPVYLMAGEVILGGKQDRVVAKDTIVPAQAKKYPVRVFCVEPHRWIGATEQFRESKLEASPAVRKAAQVSEDQARVWEEVARANRQARVAPASGAYRASAVESDTAKSAQAYVNAIAPQLKQDREAVGMVVALDGKVVGADVYASQALFRKLQGKLLASHAREAVAAVRPGAAAAPPPSATDAVRFLQRARTGQTVKREARGAAETTQLRNEAALGFQTAAPAAAGAPRQVLHENYYRNE